MKKYIKEIVWIVISIFLAIASYIMISYYLNGKIAPRLEIPVKETLFITYPYIEIVTYISILTGFLIFSIRAFINKFINNNYVLLIYNLLFILLITKIYSLNEMYSVEEGWTIYPPLSGVQDAIKIKVEGYSFITSSTYIIVLQAILILFLIYTAYKTGKNKKLS
ncbi:hypothetical protein [Flavobacterium beibuense]|uniref:hypothetical protein n=1 Tax=Flavobacterium beibuense TaxID=657326 RepID=UPI003A93F6E8